MGEREIERQGEFSEQKKEGRWVKIKKQYFKYDGTSIISQLIIISDIQYAGYTTILCTVNTRSVNRDSTILF